MSGLSEAYAKKKFVVTGEITPPRGPDVAKFNEELSEYKRMMKKLHAVNVVDNPGSLLLMSSLAASIRLIEAGVEPVYQLVCRDRNMLALESDLIAAASWGIENVLSLTGDHPKTKSSDHPNAKPVYDLDACSLLKVVSGMNAGVDVEGGKLNAKTKFFAGAALAPGATPLEPELYKTKKKINAGARFFQTQAVFESKLLKECLDEFEKTFGEDIRGSVSMSVVPLYNYGMVKFLQSMPGIVISDEIVARIKAAKDPIEEGVNMASKLIDEAKEMGVAGVHLMPAGKIEVLVRLVEEI